MQKTAYGNTKDAFLQHERWHIRTQKVAYQDAKGGLSQRKRYAFTIQYVSSDIIKRIWLL